MVFQKLFSESKIRNQTFRNRTMLAPLTRISASEDGIPNDRIRKYYLGFARGGFGALITEALYIDEAWSQTYAFQPGIANIQQALAWKTVSKSVHEADCVFIAQLIHAGALSQKNIYKSNTIAPSAIKPLGKQLAFYHGEGEYPIPEEMSEQQITDVITAFADSAERAVTIADFDGVEIHAANGYLLDQFFNDYSNHRTDKWGGNIINRLNLTIEVIKAVRERIGDKAVLGVRISQGKVNHFQHKWKEGKTGAQEIFALLNKSGVDYIHVTDHKVWEPAFADSPQSLAEIARQAAPDSILVVNGGLDTGELAESELQKGADFVAIGKAALANHNWPERVIKNEPLEELSDGILSPTAEIKDFELE